MEQGSSEIGKMSGWGLMLLIKLHRRGLMMWEEMIQPWLMILLLLLNRLTLVFPLDMKL